MKRIICHIILCIPLAGCSLFRSPPDTRTVALMPFFSTASSKSIGQEAADRVALELVAKGYVVIDRSTATALVNETKFYGSGLSDDMRNALQSRNIAAVVFGSVNDFSCETIRSPSLVASLASNMDKKNRCTVSLTAKIADTTTGRLLWGVTINDTSEGVNLTAMELMKSLIRKADIKETLPPSLNEQAKPE
ncbi:hypothetical protein F6V30_07390 [Oryzomonas sagensis]|uniref:Curli production assembly/transport component CsgG n=1 Tax=Oryzomonas sagensis TaxID=2603857 RepID=A0ABQ6TTK5_9BACT|nr:CsgG/HfaB family protein [Oryzomonas sagensis]KAB0672378.1 hypothetical protein F6V30_07390 [Oryzomonas sagensis]